MLQEYEMNKYKFYIRENKEYFEIWEDETLLDHRENYATYSLCDLVSNRETDYTDIFFWIKQNYNYIRSLVEHKGDPRYEPHTCPHSLMSFGNIFWFYYYSIDYLFENDLLETYDKNPWITYGYAETKETGTIIEIENLYSLAHRYIYNAIEGKQEMIDTPVIPHTLDVGIEIIDGVLCKVLYPKNICDILYFLVYHLIDHDISYKICNCWTNFL